MQFFASEIIGIGQKHSEKAPFFVDYLSYTFFYATKYVTASFPERYLSL